MAYEPFRNTAWRWQPGHTMDSATICHAHLLSACAVPQCEVTVTRQKLRGSQAPNEGLSFQAWSWDPQTGAWENQELPLTAGGKTDLAREQPSPEVPSYQATMATERKAWEWGKGIRSFWGCAARTSVTRRKLHSTGKHCGWGDGKNSRQVRERCPGAATATMLLGLEATGRH